ncbi:hypothetical protein A6P55_24950 (plasmid) [Pandoraea pnomenusa]|nr:hypothetical protein A6P55_24950 [Pandoraea pnomenusa]
MDSWRSLSVGRDSTWIERMTAAMAARAFVLRFRCFVMSFIQKKLPRMLETSADDRSALRHVLVVRFVGLAATTISG